MGWAYGAYGWGEGVYRVLLGKPEGRRPLERPRRRWVDNIRMDLQEVWCGYMDWIGLAQDRDRWRALVSAVMNLRVPWNAGNMLTSCKLVCFSRRTLHHGVSTITEDCPVAHSVECIELLCVRVETARTNRSWRLVPSWLNNGCYILSGPTGVLYMEEEEPNHSSFMHKWDKWGMKIMNLCTDRKPFSFFFNRLTIHYTEWNSPHLLRKSKRHFYFPTNTLNQLNLILIRTSGGL